MRLLTACGQLQMIADHLADGWQVTRYERRTQTLTLTQDAEALHYSNIAPEVYTFLTQPTWEDSDDG